MNVHKVAAAGSRRSRTALDALPHSPQPLLSLTKLCDTLVATSDAAPSCTRSTSCIGSAGGDCAAAGSSGAYLREACNRDGGRDAGRERSAGTQAGTEAGAGGPSQALTLKMGGAHASFRASFNGVLAL